MGNLLVNTVSYIGDKYFYNSPEFTQGINIIEGENGNGKSTLMNLIYYCLGGDVKSFNSTHSEKHLIITDDTNNYVELNISIDNEKYILRRSIGHNYISTSNSFGDIETYSINRNENPIIFSDWILEKLSISVLDIYQGTNSFKLNIKDIFRLIFHDQNPDPKKVFKSPDAESFISDSEYVRKLIFRMLLGKKFEEYYNSLGKLKKAENDKKVAQSLLNEFELISSQLYSDENEVLNIDHLKVEISELNDQLSRLIESRELLRIQRPIEANSAWKDIDSIKSSLLQIELNLQSKKDDLNKHYQDLNKYEKYKIGLIKEVTQLNKIIHAHKTLEIFSQNSCPFCHGELKREENNCYCGNDIKEETFEKFFFSSDEYWDLLKARKKSVETVDLVIDSTKKEIERYELIINADTEKSDFFRFELKNKLSHIDRANIDIDKLNEVDDKSLEVKNSIQNLEKKLDFEEKFLGYKSSFEKLDNLYKGFSRDTKILELTSNKEMESIVSDFNKIYDTFMTATLKNCRSAKIDSDSYDPVIDGGVYREASSRVSIRLNYFLTILKMSLDNQEVKHPKYLMIDTPQTAGLDPDELKKLLSQMIVFGEKNFQVILTTGHGLYPDEFKSNVKITLTDEDKLLKPRV